MVNAFRGPAPATAAAAAHVTKSRRAQAAQHRSGALFSDDTDTAPESCVPRRKAAPAPAAVPAGGEMRKAAPAPSAVPAGGEDDSDAFDVMVRHTHGLPPKRRLGGGCGADCCGGGSGCGGGGGTSLTRSLRDSTVADVHATQLWRGELGHPGRWWHCCGIVQASGASARRSSRDACRAPHGARRRAGARRLPLARRGRRVLRRVTAREADDDG